jgi:hypothetical protein
MADLHIDEFYKDAAIILAQLYAAFPRKTSVYVEDVAGADRPDEFGLHSKRHLGCFGTMLWLGEEGWIRYVDTIGQMAIDQATLTQTAFVLLGSHHGQPQPEADDRTSPGAEAESCLRIDLLRGALKSGNSMTISRTVKATLFSR